MRRGIEDFDFIFIFEGMKQQMLDFWKADVESLLLSHEIDTRIVVSEAHNQTYMLVGLNSQEQIYRQAEHLGILKERNKASFEIQPKDIQKLEALNSGNKKLPQIPPVDRLQEPQQGNPGAGETLCLQN